MFIVFGFPSIEGGSGQADVAAGPMDIADLFGVFQYA
jgi:hypothetical protein